MRLKIKINGEDFISPEIIGKGLLGAHLVVSDFEGDVNHRIDFDITGYNTNDSEVTEYLNWNPREVKEGDIITINVMPKDNFVATPPEYIKKSSENKTLHLTNEEVADKAIKTVLEYNGALEELLNDASSLSDIEKTNLKFAIAQIINANFEKVLEPIFRVYPDKRPDEMKNMPL